jgi:hypothetical protein
VTAGRTSRDPEPVQSIRNRGLTIQDGCRRDCWCGRARNKNAHCGAITEGMK